MEFGRIDREVHIDATPEVVFEVITSPEHIRDWWEPGEVSLDATPGGAGELVWGDRSSPEGHVATLTVVEVEPPRLFSFRWVYPEDAVADARNSLLVTFEVTPSATGSVLRLTETGFREKGWEVAVLEQQYQDHVQGWDYFVPRLAALADKVASSR
jgi:uncharacterized protein YndB with AHSA1/START domain